METRQFKYFIRIADLGSVTKAAKALHIAQPALSAQIAQLEEELGQKLFVRSHSGVRLTEAGEVFYRHAQRLLKQFGDIYTAVQQAGANPTGTVCVGLPMSTASQFAFPLLAAVRSRFPGIEIEFHGLLSGDILHGLNSGRLDLAVVVNDDDASLLNATPLMDETLFLVSRPDLAPTRSPFVVEYLIDLPLMLPSVEHGIGGLVEQVFLSRGFDPPKPAFVANSMSIMRQAVLAGMAHCILPWGAVAEDVAAKVLTITEITPPVRRRAYVCTAKDNSLLFAGEVVRSALIEETRAHVRAGEWKGIELL